MSEHTPPKPISVEFFIPGVDPPLLPKSTAPKAPATPSPEEQAARIEIASTMPTTEPDYADDPESMIADLLGALPRGVGSPDPEQAARDAKTMRHNTHMTAQRLIEMEKRRQRRGQNGRKK